jgi:hypothetical protein
MIDFIRNFFRSKPKLKPGDYVRLSSKGLAQIEPSIRSFYAKSIYKILMVYDEPINGFDVKLHSCTWIKSDEIIKVPYSDVKDQLYPEASKLLVHVWRNEFKSYIETIEESPFSLHDFKFTINLKMDTPIEVRQRIKSAAAGYKNVMIIQVKNHAQYFNLNIIADEEAQTFI